MVKTIEVRYRTSFAGGVGHTATDEFDENAVMEIPDNQQGIWIHETLEHKKAVSYFYPNTSIIRVKVVWIDSTSKIRTKNY